MGVYEELKARGLIAQVTDEEAVRDLLDNQKCAFYIGFDPTADSLHVGHFVTIMTMARLQRAGHTPIALFGGGTGMIGDPSGKTDMRKMLTRAEIDHNVECFRKQMAPLIDFSEGKAIMANNADWLLDLNYVEFMREIGVHFSVNRMLAAECYKQRLERGLTFFEMNYMLMQGYDFLQLNRRYNCVLEVGGDDQWSNIIGGVNLIRCKEQRPAYGLTLGLLTNSEGKKMGKTEKGAVWLDAKKTTPFEFYQYWRNIGDGDVERCLKFLTFLPLEEIHDLTDCDGSALNKAKEVLAYEVTKAIHGKEEAEKAREGARALFGGGAHTDNMPTSTITAADMPAGSIGVLDLLAKVKLVSSKSEGRRLVQQGGLTINDVKVKDPAAVLTSADFPNGAAVIRKGKKVYHKVLLS
ncbi:MAG: tyrosine--tRNA ligase [Oscillospiraceae bacterium]|jgi:tyrosyl-tRNA synthetase|nr:tyrosine--tRNA ligase [Oscillospiraceae bacterium]MDD3260974.1 tyrosine--tRNA ligase [Oscillospiraceae bacterium]